MSVEYELSPGAKLPWWFYLIFYGVGVVCLAAAVIIYISTSRFLALAQHAQGKVIEYRRDVDEDNGVVYFPIVEFSAGNELYTFESGTGSSSRPYQKGDAVAVLYHPDNPEKAEIESFWAQWLGVMICGLIGIVFIGLTVAIHFIFRAAAKPKSAAGQSP